MILFFCPDLEDFFLKKKTQENLVNSLKTVNTLGLAMVELEHANRVRTAWYAGSTYWEEHEKRTRERKRNHVL